MRVVSLTGASSVVDPEHGEHHAGSDGVFELPQPFAEHLTKTAAGMWRGEADHLSQMARESLEELLDPRVALRVLSELRERMGGLEARVAVLEAPQATAGGEEESEDESDPDASDGADSADEQESEPQDDGDGEDEESEQEAEGEIEEDFGVKPELALEEVAEPEEAPKPATARRPGTDRPPRVRPAPKFKA